MNNLTTQQINSLKSSVGNHNRLRELSPIQVADILVQLSPKADMVEIARQIGLSGTSILKQLCSLKTLPSHAHDLISWGNQQGKLSFSVAAEIARLKDSQQATELIRLALDNRLSKIAVRLIIRDARQTHNSISDSFRKYKIVTSKKSI